METFCEFGVVVGVYLKCGEVDADCRSITDGGCSAHLQLTDCRPDFALRFEVKVFGAVWEFCLVNDDEGALAVVEGNGFHGENVCVHCVSHFQKINVPPPPQAVPLPRHTGEAKKNGYIDCTRHLVIRGRLARIITGVVEKN